MRTLPATGHFAAMRWDALFADLEAQLEEVDRAELAAEVADRTRRELALVALGDRLRAAAGRPLEMHVRGAGRVAGRLLEVGPDWLLAEERHEVLLPLSALLAVTGLPPRTAAPQQQTVVSRRLRLGAALRGLVRERATVAVTLVDGTVLQGTLDRVGADHVDLAEHVTGEARRAASVRRVSTLPFEALGLVRAS